MKASPAGLCSVFHCFLMSRHYQGTHTNVSLRHTVPFPVLNTCCVSLPEEGICFDPELDYSVTFAFTKLKFPISRLGNVCRPKFYVLLTVLLLDPCNENQLDELFILSLFRQPTSTGFGHICSPSSGGILYMYKTYQLF